MEFYGAWISVGDQYLLPLGIICLQDAQKLIFQTSLLMGVETIQVIHIIQDKEKYDETSKKCKRPQTHSISVTQLGDIIDVDPSSYEEVAKEKWKKIDEKVPVDHGEWCLGCGSKTWREVCSVFHVDLQDQAWSRWKHQEVQIKVHGFSYKEGVDYGMTYSIDQTHFSSEGEV